MGRHKVLLGGFSCTWVKRDKAEQSFLPMQWQGFEPWPYFKWEVNNYLTTTLTHSFSVVLTNILWNYANQWLPDLREAACRANKLILRPGSSPHPPPPPGPIYFQSWISHRLPKIILMYFARVTLKNHISGVIYSSISSYTSLERKKNTLSKKNISVVGNP